MFYCTFGSQYSYEEHPVSKHIHPDGYVTVAADDRATARELIVKTFGEKWSFEYDAKAETMERRFYPLGEIGHIDANGVLMMYAEAV